MTEPFSPTVRVRYELFCIDVAIREWCWRVHRD